MSLPDRSRLIIVHMTPAGAIRKLVTCCIVSIGLLASPVRVWATSKAWLINGDGKAVKLDLNQNTIGPVQTLPVSRVLIEEVVVDPFRGNLLVPFGRGPYRVAVLDMRTLRLKGNLDIAVDHAPSGEADAIRFLFPGTGDKFFVRWWNPTASGGVGAFEVLTVNATTFTTTAHQVTTPPLSDKLLLDTTGTKLYSLNSRKPAQVDIFDIPAFTKTTTIDLEGYFNPSLVGRGIDDFRDGRVILVENEAIVRNDKSSYTVFLFDIMTGHVYPKIRTGLRGDARLLSRSRRILFDEEINLRPGAEMLSPTNLISP